MRVCVIGAGLTGLVAGYRLSRSGHAVTILEKENKIGGLMRSFSVGGDKIPMAYHHIMKFDDSSRKLIDELGLMEKYYERNTKMGFFYGNKIYKLSKPTDILGFHPLSFRSRIKFAVFGAKVLLARDWEKLERVTARDWITKNANDEIYNKIFKPLLKSKFSVDHDRIMARWVGERLKMGESSGPFGYLLGGLEQILNKLEMEILENGGHIKPNCKATKLKTKNKRIFSIVFEERDKIKILKVDCVIYTGEIPSLASMAEFPRKYTDRLRSIRYKSTICAVIGHDGGTPEHYWLNILDDDFHFGGVIAHSILNPHIKSAKTILYIFKYLNSTDDLWKISDSDILDLYERELSRIYHTGTVKWKRLFRMRFSKPVYEVGYSRLDHKTPIENLYLGGPAIFYPKIRNMGTAIETGEKLAEIVEVGNG